MLFETMSDNLYESCEEFDLILMKVSAFYEAAVREAEITKQKATYEYTSESVGRHEYSYICEDTQDKLLDRFFAAVKKIIEAVKKFFADIRDKVIALYRDSKVSALISTAKKKIGGNPFLKRRQCNPLPDFEVVMKIYQDEERYLDQQAAADNTGNFDRDVFDEHETKFAIELNSAKKQTAVLSTQSAVDKCEKATKLVDHYTARSKEVTSSIEAKTKSINKSKETNNLLTILKKKAKIAQEEASYILSVAMSYQKEIAKSIKSAIENAKDVVDEKKQARMDAKAAKKAAKKANATSQKTVKESYDDDYDYDEEDYDDFDSAYESTIDVDDYIDSIMSNINDSDSTYESYDDDYDYDEEDYDDFDSAYESYDDDDYYDEDFDVDSFLD